MHTPAIHDLNMFSAVEDCQQWETPAASSTNLLDMQIEHNSNRALMVSDATTQLMLATLEEEGSPQQLQRHEQAEQLAYDLGLKEFSSTSQLSKKYASVDNPFTQLNLQQAWDNGFTRGAIDYKNANQKLLDTQLWGSTNQSTQHQTQYAIAALTLFNIAESTDDTSIQFRATQLANEMIHYSAQNPPSPQRQLEIDQFLSKQASQLAEDLGF